MSAFSPVLSRAAPVPLKSRPLGLTDWRLYLVAAVLSAANILVPLALHTVPNAGPVFLPLFFFTLVAAWQFGLGAALIVAVASPLLSFTLTGMPLPAMLPVVLAKSLALGVAASLLANASRSVSLPGILLAVAAMQMAGFLAERIVGLPLEASWKLFALSWPGMAIMVLGGYALLRWFNAFLSAGTEPQEDAR